MPRSGTTLVEQIISSHHAVYGADELSTISDLTSSILADPSTQDKITCLKSIFYLFVKNT